MATLDFSKAKQGADMGAPQLSGQPSFVEFQQAGSVLTGTNWNWTTPGGHRVDLDGTGFTYDDFTGRATGGTVNTIRIDLGNNDVLSPDIVITGLNASAPPLAEEPEDFWNILAGDDTITGGTRASAGDAFFRIAGDGLHAAPGTSKGGNDLININDARTYAFGDVFEADSEKAGRIAYTGGNDTITSAATDLMQSITGDVWDAYGDVRIYGGNDTLVLRSTLGGSGIVGDVTNMQGSIAGRAIVVGGHDALLAGEGVTGRMVGDVMNQNYYSILRGGNDYIAGSDMAQTMVGDVYNSEDTVTGGADTIYGYGGGDVISGDAYGASGNLTGGNDEIYGGDGNDTIRGEAVKYGAIRMAGGNDKLYGEEGNDNISGQTGNDFLDGGNGDDFLSGDTGNDRLYGGSGNDGMHGGDGSDILDGGSGNDGLSGGDGNDILNGGSDNDMMAGAIGNDIYVVDNYLDIVTENAGEGTDTVKTTLNALAIGAEIENLTFVGNGNFEGRGNNLSNRITGGNGDDTFTMDGSGNDTIIGLGGTDSLDFRALGGAIVNLATNANGGSADGDRFYSIERIFGSDTGGDRLAATNSRVIFFGYGGNDTLTGGGGQDSLYGGEGNDRISGGSGHDAYLGGEGGNDLLSGGVGHDSLDGGTGNDRMQGDEGNDTMRGGEGNDVMSGNDGHDDMHGDSGADLIAGGLGRDTMTGGMDADRFDFDAVTESGPGTARDIITDFTVDPAAGAAYIDRIDVSTIDAMMGAAGNQAFGFVGSGAFTGEGQIRAIQVGGDTLLQFNVVGGSGAEMEILLMNVQANTLSAADFIL